MSSKPKELPIVSDLYHRAVDMFPGYDREEALNLYTAKKLADGEKLLVAYRNDNNALRDDLKTYQDEIEALQQFRSQADQELDRIKQLSNPEQNAELLQRIQRNFQELQKDKEDIENAVKDHEAEKQDMIKLRGILDKRAEEMQEIRASEKKTKEHILAMSNILKGINDATDSVKNDVSQTVDKFNKVKKDLDRLKKTTFELQKDYYHRQTMKKLRKKQRIIEGAQVSNIFGGIHFNYDLKDDVEKIIKILYVLAENGPEYWQDEENIYELSRITKELIEIIDIYFSHLRTAREDWAVRSASDQKYWIEKYKTSITYIISSLSFLYDLIPQEKEYEKLAEKIKKKVADMQDFYNWSGWRLTMPMLSGR